MAGSLHLIAANGTDNRTDIIDTGDETLNYFLDEMQNSDDDLAARLLRAAALSTLREQAGYIPANDPRPMEKVMQVDDTHHQDRYSAQIVGFLSKIYRGNYAGCYPEWLHYVALQEATFPYEALPLMLILATWFPETQALTKRVIGSRGRWLIENSRHKNWHWAKHIKPARRPRLSKYRKYEGRIIYRLQKLGYRRLPLEISYELRLMRFPWTETFSQGIASTIENVFSRQNGLSYDDLLRFTDTIKWCIHPDMRETIVSSFRQYNQLDETQAIARNLDTLLEFRSAMLDVFMEEWSAD